MKAVTDEIPLESCRSRYESLGQLNLRKIMPQNVMESQMCAHYEGIDTCQGFSSSFGSFTDFTKNYVCFQVILERQFKLFPTTTLRDIMQSESSPSD